MRYKVLFVFLVTFLPLPIYHLYGLSLLSPLSTFIIFFITLGDILGNILDQNYTSYQGLEYILLILAGLFTLISLTLNILLINFLINYISIIFNKNFTLKVQQFLLLSIFFLIAGIISFIPLYYANESFSLLDFIEEVYYLFTYS